MYRLYEVRTGVRPLVILGRTWGEDLVVENLFISEEGAQVIAQAADPDCEKYGVEVAP